MPQVRILSPGPRACCKTEICSRPFFTPIFVTGTEFKPGLWKAFHNPGMLTQALPFWQGLKSENL